MIKIRILDLGCGKNKFPGGKNETVIGADVMRIGGVDVVFDFDKWPWLFKSSQFDAVICSHVMEHLSDLSKTMDEIWRIGKSDALIKIKSPYFANYRAHADPSHKRCFTSQSFDYFDPDTELAESWPLGNEGVFKIIERRVLFGRSYNIFVNVFNRILPFYERYLAYIFPARQVYFELRVIKGEAIS